ncbi:MAG: 4-phosphoerythronate dehydrogenase [Candidatus Sumerlaeia bacterium]|nr:4-phosphoerythronate dehydrogenase [Candidatus Sumerlaeia bacterium]
MADRERLIVADANIPRAEEAFGPLGRVRLLPGREIRREDLVEADALIVRSVTRVDSSLLRGTPVGFVGTATIGTDHLDTTWLDETGIPWASAAGCNARSVVEYVLAVIMEWCSRNKMPGPSGMTLGIVGHGNIGSRLAPVASSLGMRVLVCDPPQMEAGAISDGLALGEVLGNSDVVTFHVPYTRSGPHPTHHMVGERELGLLRDGTLMVNSSRGAVVNNTAALAEAGKGRVTFALDVFEGEPTPARELVDACWIATPHIAGYSLEGKTNGTNMMATVLAEHFGVDAPPSLQLATPVDAVLDLGGRTGLEAILHAVRHSYSVFGDDDALRRGRELPGDEWGRHFDSLRRLYRERREFSNYTISGADQETAAMLGRLGFGVA